MKWKKHPSGMFLFLTLLHCALCNHQSHNKLEKRKGFRNPTGSAVAIASHGSNGTLQKAATDGGTGEQRALLISQLDDLSVLDPYNLIDARSKDDINPLLDQIIFRNNAEVGEAAQTEGDRTKLNGLAWDSRPESRDNSTSKFKLISHFSPVNGDKITTVDLDPEKVGTRWLRWKKRTFFDRTMLNRKNKHRDGNHRTEDPLENDFKQGEGRRRKKPGYTLIDTNRNALLHEAVRKLLGFTNSPEPGSSSDRLLPDPRKEKRLPKYVKDLYKKFKRGEMNGALLNGNTVRSIHTTIGEVEGLPMFLFNLSSLRPSEQLLSAEVHLYKRRLQPWVRRLEVEVAIYQVAPHYISRLRKITLRNTTYGWQRYEVTDAVRNCLSGIDALPHMFGFTVLTHRPNGKSKPVSVRKFGRHHSLPFLVVYSNETEAVSFEQLDHLADRLRIRDNDDDDDDDGGSSNLVNSRNHELTGAPTAIDEDSTLEEDQDMDFSKNAVLQGRRERFDTNTKDEKEKEDLALSNSKADIVLGSNKRPNRWETSRDPRNKRSVLTNEIPEDPTDFNKFNLREKFLQTHPGILKARKESRIQLGNAGIIPFPDSHLQRRRKRKHRRQKQKRRYGRLGRRLRVPKEWENYQESFVQKEKTDSNVCARRKLAVDFADIGWGDWIISPKSFEAHYCAGECPFPLTKRLRPSNHATIQSIVHAIGIYDNVPAPCCVPDVMSSVTLLYFDEDRNVVLKNYPGMTVQSCACR